MEQFLKHCTTDIYNYVIGLLVFKMNGLYVMTHAILNIIIFGTSILQTFGVLVEEFYLFKYSTHYSSHKASKTIS